MKVLVTGATGFIGQYLVPELLARHHSVMAVARDAGRAQKMPWHKQVTFIASDIYDPALDPLRVFGVPDAVVHLAWPGLPNYKDLFHFEKNLPADYAFLKSMILGGVKHVLVTGTCLEYGMQSGALSEETVTVPATPYGLAKDTLRKFLQALQSKHLFTLQWVRLFYMYGPGQNPGSLLAQLDSAIARKEAVFNMSGGEQVRDYLPVEEAARDLASLLDHPDCSGIINCCSGNPITVRQLVEQRIADRRSDIKLNLGHYPYPDYEPMAFWGDNTKIKSLK
ncbi:MAG: NAD(P)-dependent oxidoreductase [Candidatus Omnitrophica bacterium]|nr:NAD(P)-dependent oxidoreductase [Candidatus Omnitrophota bacterium]